MSKAAKMDALEALHAAVADVLKVQLQGEEVSPQMIAQAIKFLKDNGVEPAKDADTSALDALQERVNKFTSGEEDDDLVSSALN